ncbi:MAG: C39 family peptidase [Verrucomicrobia bacterium]|nr:C39 family peptidase [Verrucomicrobiota bacterium]
MRLPPPFLTGCSRGVAILGMFLAAATPAADARLLTVTNFSAFQRERVSTDLLVLTSPALDPGIPWKELVVSWNATSNVTLSIGARPVVPGGVPFLSLGRWTLTSSGPGGRGSVNGQKEPWGEVQTDVLSLRREAHAAEVRLEMRGPESGLRRLALAFSGGGNVATAAPPFTGAWGRDLPVPVRSQAEFPEGVTRWCSPTSTTMLMAYWGEQRGRADWIPTVPETVRGVFDPGWEGTGNWPFNMAFAGAHRDLNAVVARWEGLPDLERWVAAGLPAAASVSYALLKGRAAAESGDGHLVVVRGWTAAGDVRVNDPGVRRERVERVFPRGDFDRAWAHSGRTVYLVWPDGQPLPEGPRYPR